MTRAFIHHLANKETVGAHLLTMHNLSYLLNLVGAARDAILADRFPRWVKEFFALRFPRQDDKDDGVARYPAWAVEALDKVGIELLNDY